MGTFIAFIGIVIVLLAFAKFFILLGSEAATSAQGAGQDHLEAAASASIISKNQWRRFRAATPFLFSYFCVFLGVGQRYFVSFSSIYPDEALANIEWATNTQNALNFMAVVSGLHVLYNQRAKASSAE